MDDRTPNVLSLRSAPAVRLTWEMPQGERETASSGFSPGRQCVSLLTDEENSSWKYSFRSHDSCCHVGLEEYRFESFPQSVKTILMLTTIQSFTSLNH